MNGGRLQDYRPLLVTGAGLVLLPFVLTVLGLTYTSASEVVIFGMACLGLNILVGFTGLVSFGHGAWFGLAAYTAAIVQREYLPGHVLLPALAALALVAVSAALFGALILRRRGVYFSLMTLALAAMLYSIAFRWTSLTGGENGLGNITRPVVAGLDLSSSERFYWLVAAIGLVVVFLLWRFHRSPVGSVLVAIRENESRARFLGYDTARYKLLAFTLSAIVTGVAGTLLLLNNRMTSADPISVAFSGEMLAMVVIGGMRSFLGPALGALFFILFREFLSSYTADWLMYFGLLFVGFIVFSPTGLVGVAARLLAPFRPKLSEAAAMAGRTVEEGLPLPDSLRQAEHGDGPILVVRELAKNFGGIQAVRNLSFEVGDRSLHALIGPNGAGKTTAFNLISGQFPLDHGEVLLAGRPIQGLRPDRITRAGIGRSFQITNLFPALSVWESMRLAVQARHPGRWSLWRAAGDLETINAETAELIRWVGLKGLEPVEAGSLSYGGQRLVDLGVALATRPRLLLLDEPLAGLFAGERQRISELVKRLSADLPVLLVEHDIDRVFQLADRVTVMNDGEVLTDGTADDARTDPRVQTVYIGSGAAEIASRPRHSAAEPTPLLGLDKIDAFYGKSHILNGVSLQVYQHEIVALLGRNGAGKSTVLKAIIGIVQPPAGTVTLGAHALHGLPSAAIARLGVGYVPQGRGLFAGMSVAHNLELGRLRRTGGDGVRWDLDKVLDFFPRIRQRLDVPADFLSGGEQQMVAVARALVGNVRVLLLDEPFEGLAPAIVEELFEAFDRLRREISIVIVDHHLELAMALSDRTYVLERGRVIHEGPSAALLADLDLRRQVLWV